MSPRKIDFGDSGWDAHRRDHWLDIAAHAALPDYLRVTCVAYAKRQPNGHAPFRRGELAALLVRPDGTVPERRQVWAAVRQAAGLGWLRPESGLLCLVVPEADVQGGDGAVTACRRNHAKRGGGARDDVAREGGRFTNVGDHHRRSGSNVGDETGRSEANVGDQDRRSVLSPSLFYTQTTDNPTHQPIANHNVAVGASAEIAEDDHADAAAASAVDAPRVTVPHPVEGTDVVTPLGVAGSARPHVNGRSEASASPHTDALRRAARGETDFPEPDWSRDGRSAS